MNAVRPRRFRYRIDLAGLRPPPVPTSAEAVVRSPTADDVPALAALMLDAYRDTIDYEGEEIEQATEAILEVMNGEPRLSASGLAVVGGEPASAVLVADYDGDHYISYVLTAPPFQRRGICRALVERTLDVLQRDGLSHVHLAITEGNVPSEALFRSLGAYVAHP